MLKARKYGLALKESIVRQVFFVEICGVRIQILYIVSLALWAIQIFPNISMDMRAPSHTRLFLHFWFHKHRRILQFLTTISRAMTLGRTRCPGLAGCGFLCQGGWPPSCVLRSQYSKTLATCSDRMSVITRALVSNL